MAKPSTPAPPKGRSGDPDYRSYVGGPGRYDLLAGIQFSMLLDAGLREDHRVVDIGCGSLRLGRLLIPYLLPDRYFGVEPNEWLVQEGFDKELGHDIIELKRPRFRYVDDFSLDGFGELFDCAIAYSVWTHCYPDLAEHGLRQVARTLAPGGVLIGSFVENKAGVTSRSRLLAPNGSGWLYPKCVKYTWEEMSATLERAGLVGYRVNRQTAHRQEWFVAAPPAHHKAARRVAIATARPAPLAMVGDAAHRVVEGVRRDPAGALRALRRPRAALASLQRPPALKR